jgi:hypothetical protein
LLPGAVNTTVAVVNPVEVAVPMPGCPGTVHVVMLFDIVELAPDPNEFAALTVNVYGTPDVNPLTVIVPDPA